MTLGNLENTLIERITVGVVAWRLGDDPTHLRLVFVNPAASTIGHADFAASLGACMSDRFPTAFAQGRHLAYAEVLESRLERTLPAGSYPELARINVYGRMVPLPDRHVVVLFDDARKSRALAETELRKVNAFLDSIIDNIPAMVFVKDAQHLRYELFNRAGEMMSGFKREDIYGKSARDLFPAEQADFFLSKDRAVLGEGKMLDIPEEPINTPLGKRWLHTKKIPIPAADGSPGHLLGISLDITERKLALEALERAHAELEQRVAERTHELLEANQRLQREMDERQRAQLALSRAEEQLRQAQKLEAVGRLAGGIAHDFNNLLSVILSYAGLLAAGSETGVPLDEGLTQITKASERAAALTRQLLAFSRQQVLAPRVVDLNELVQSVSTMLERVIGEDVRIVIVRAPDLGHTRADVGQLEQVMMNLVVNARDAMPRGGSLTIETSNADLGVEASEALGATPGSYVVLSVSDDGVGMNEATLARAFEPFFTTKLPGKGTGLGLSTVFGIVKQSGGHITVTSQPGRGSSFRIYFPRTDEPLSLAAPSSRSPRPSRGTETLLLVEDDEQVRTVAREILEAQGYRVLQAATPREALELSQRNPGVALLVTDLVMPDMNGRQLAERLLRQRPELRVLYMSGYTNSVLGEEVPTSPGSAFLQKPLTPASLAGMVRQLLDRKPLTRS
jgi:PAS domain S-box-containing protein